MVEKPSRRRRLPDAAHVVLSRLERSPNTRASA
jgi:hypothetical protein